MTFSGTYIAVYLIGHGWERANETVEETRQRLDKQRELQSASRNRLSGIEKEAQLKTHRDDQSRYIHNLTDDRVDERLDMKREYQSNYIASQTEEQIAERLDNHKGSVNTRQGGAFAPVVRQCWRCH